MKTTLAALRLAVLLVAAPALAAPDVTLDDLAWMAGTWASKKGNVETEEHWTAPKGGLMLGLHRDVMPGGKAAFEFLRIETDAEGLVYLARPQDREATPFRLVEAGDRRVVFANPDHDFPQRILYWMEDGQLCARVEGESGGRARRIDWRWERVASPGR